MTSSQRLRMAASFALHTTLSVAAKSKDASASTPAGSRAVREIIRPTSTVHKAVPDTRTRHWSHFRIQQMVVALH